MRFLEESEKVTDRVYLFSVGVLKVDDLVDTGSFVFDDSVDQGQNEVGQIGVTFDVLEN